MRAMDDVTFVQSMRNSRPHIQKEPRVCELKLNSSAGRCFEFRALMKQKQDSCLLSCFDRCTRGNSVVQSKTKQNFILDFSQSLEETVFSGLRAECDKAIFILLDLIS